MAKSTWAVHVIAADGQESFGFRTADDAKGFQKDVSGEGRLDFVSSVIRLVPGETYWVVHVRNSNGKMQSFGFDTKKEATKFHKAILKSEAPIDCVSMPAMAELNDDRGVLDWTPDN